MKALLVLAKAPEPGRCKTRLCPPCTPTEAAGLAEAALADTLEIVAATPAVDRRVLVLDGQPGPWLPPSFDVLPQRGRGLDERLANAFVDAAQLVPPGTRAPWQGILVGMDTPQISAEMLTRAHAALAAPGIDAVLGPALDGGWWAIGLRRPDPSVFLGVPMSTPGTGRAQRRRLWSLGLSVAGLPAQRDVDRFADALAVAAEIPHSRFARAVAGLMLDGVAS